MLDVTAIGELLIDFATISTDQSGYPTMAANPGGAPCNYLAALEKCGARTALLGKVGKDMFGDLLIGTAKAVGIETRGIVQSEDAFTTLAFVAITAEGEREFSFARKPGADTMLTYGECDLALVDDARAFHFGTLSLTDGPVREATRQTLQYAKEKKKIITFDPNLRIPLWDSLERAKKEILWGLGQADIVKISDEEIRFLWNCGEAEGAKRLLEEYGASLVFVTLGKRGCYYTNGDAFGYALCPDVRTVDTTGAGDIFGGAAVAGVLRTGKALQALTEAELEHITTFACGMASLSTEKYGGICSIPELAAVEEKLRMSLG